MFRRAKSCTRTFPCDMREEVSGPSYFPPCSCRETEGTVTGDLCSGKACGKDKGTSQNTCLLCRADPLPDSETGFSSGWCPLRLALTIGSVCLRGLRLRHRHRPAAAIMIQVAVWRLPHRFLKPKLIMRRRKSGFIGISVCYFCKLLKFR